MGSHFGSFRSQNAKGHLLGHVRDLGLDVSNANVRYYQTTRQLEYHTDSCDIVGADESLLDTIALLGGGLVQTDYRNNSKKILQLIECKQISHCDCNSIATALRIKMTTSL